MNYIQLLKESLRLLRTTKQIWSLVLLTLPFVILQDFIHFLYVKYQSNCLYQARVACVLICVFLYGCLVYTIHHASLDRKPSFSEAWSKGKSKIFSLIGVSFLSTPFLLSVLGGFIIYVTNLRAPHFYRLIAWILVSLIIHFGVSFVVFGICAVVLNDVKVWQAAMTSRLITLNNIFRITVINASFAITFLLVAVLIVGVPGYGLARVISESDLGFLSYLEIKASAIFLWAGSIFALFLLPLFFSIMTLAYKQFISEETYPALTHKLPINKVRTSEQSEPKSVEPQP